MWILPKQLHTLASVQDTEGLSLDLNESSQLCAQSLFVRSKPSPLRTWLQKWKRDSWTQHLFGRILKPSLGKAFEIEWTSLLAVTPVSLSVQQESEPGKTTQDTFGPGLQMELLQCDQSYVSLKTSKDISCWGCPTSSRTWQEWVIERRGAYSARLNAVRHTNGSACSSWPTASARDWKDSSGMAQTGLNPDGSQRNRTDQLARAVFAISGQPAPANHSTHGSRPESWRTPSSSDGVGGIMEMRPGCAGKYKLRDHVAAWATPRQADAAGVDYQYDQGNHQKPRLMLPGQVKAWATPTACDHKSCKGKEDRDCKELTPMVERTQVGKLNPRWVETLMGLPIGWTMPSCTSPVTIVQTSSASLETASCLPAQR
jgi:hypothetical protein